MANEKIQCMHPDGKHAPAIAVETYHLFHKAIIAVLKKSQLSFTEIADGVKDYLTKKNIKFSGSPDWYTVTVKLDMEARKEIETFVKGGTKMHRLIT